MRLLLLWLASAAAFIAPTTVRTETAVYGRGDKRTRRGKIYRGSSGISRFKKKKNPDKIVDPYFTLREWGKRQDPPLTVEEVIELKVSQKLIAKVTPEDALLSVTKV